MKIVLRPSFVKNFGKLDARVRHKFIERKALFETDPFHPLLKNHSLSGEYEGCRSINIAGDYRAIYFTHGTTCIFIRIGTHPQLYE